MVSLPESRRIGFDLSDWRLRDPSVCQELPDLRIRAVLLAVVGPVFVGNFLSHTIRLAGQGPAQERKSAPVEVGSSHLSFSGIDARASAERLAEDRGAAAVAQSLKKLATRASLMMIVAHPDDEDGGMLTYESRGQGVDTTLLTVNRGEGGQNVMSNDYWDQLGLVRTEELLAAGEHYGVHQHFTRVADYGFSKTIDEALKTWGHDRVLYDAVLVVRETRPLVVSSVFAGNVSDGHGQHQVSGLMAQEVYKAAGDPNIFPDQIKAGLRPWSPVKVYARVPFARVTEKGIYDYATGRWGPVRFRNYVTGTWIEGIPTATLEVPEGQYDPVLGKSYIEEARLGLALQRSQNGGIGAPPKRAFDSGYHLYASRLPGPLPTHEASFFEGVDTSLAGIAGYVPEPARAVWTERLRALQATVAEAARAFDAADPGKTAPLLAKGLGQTNALLVAIQASELPEDAKYNMTHELRTKQTQFNDALGQALAISVQASVINGKDLALIGPYGDFANQAGTSQTAIPMQKVYVDVHLANQGSQAIEIVRADVVSQTGGGWTIVPEGKIVGAMASGASRDEVVTATAGPDAALTKPYFARPNLEQSHYDVLEPKYLDEPTMPYPLAAEVTYRYDGVEGRIGGVVQTIHRTAGLGPVPEPLLLAPAISLTVSPQAGIVPLRNASLTLQVTVHSSVKGPTDGRVRLQMPAGWTSQPAEAEFQTRADGEDRVLSFLVTPKSVEEKPYTITAVAQYGGREYREGFRNVGYAGLRPYPFYRESTYRTSGVDVKVAPGLRVAYIMGPGDDVARSLEDMGVHATFLSAGDVASADLSGYDAIVLGIRAYAARPELKTSNARLLNYVKKGGVIVTQYQTQEYDHNYGPYPLTLSGDPEKVVEEDQPVTLLAPANPVLNWPNRITTKDFDGWVEERGHGFMREWDPHYTALTEMHDVGQDPQKGGLLYAHYGKGAYVYTSFAFYREMPDGVAGAFRILANLISLGKNEAFRAEAGSGR